MNPLKNCLGCLPSRHRNNAAHASHAENNSQELTAVNRRPPLSAEIISTARRVYNKLRMYHGTSRESAHDIRQHGFSLSRKSGGAVAASLKMKYLDPVNDRGLIKSSAGVHHITPNRELAGQYAGAARASHQQPTLVRTMLSSQQRASLVDDPYTRQSINRAYVTDKDIPANSIVQTKGNQQSEEVLKVFHQGLLKERVECTIDEAAVLFDEVQSDDEEEGGSTGR